MIAKHVFFAVYRLHLPSNTATIEQVGAINQWTVLVRRLNLIINFHESIDGSSIARLMSFELRDLSLSLLIADCCEQCSRLTLSSAASAQAIIITSSSSVRRQSLLQSIELTASSDINEPASSWKCHSLNIEQVNVARELK